MKDVVIEVSKGAVTEIYCDAADLRFVVLDWDLLERDDQGNPAFRQDQVKLRSLPAAAKKELIRVIAD